MDKVQTEDQSPTSTGPRSLEQHGKRRREPLTRERIIRTALRIMDEEGLDAVTMRHIGRQLGVEAMSLYNHVRDKEEILDGICEEVLAEFRVPQVEGWTEAARLGAHEYRRLLLAHPNVITLMTERKGAFTNAESLRAYEFALGLFRSAGLSEADSVKAFHTFGGYILGFVTMELGLMIGGPEDEAHVQAHEAMARLVASADLPRLREALPYIIDCDVEEQFEFGLDLLIQGLRARTPPTG
ncbi:MAG TPA: TetR/AcrR family transcriptional regulator C-terminal domain-containing protein [Actinomycetota bacterium]|nr:TetR/AcrR family transcriptional regulator C-terminal domain-containing protein [Actinomycetota bacterium]